MNNSKVEQLLIPQDKVKAVLCTGKLGIRSSQDTITLLRQTFKTNENAAIIQLDAIKPLQNTKVIFESRVFKDITNCVNIGQEYVAVYKKNRSTGESQEDLSIEHVHASRTATPVYTGFVRSVKTMEIEIGYVGTARNMPMSRRVSVQLPKTVSELQNKIRLSTPLGTRLIANRVQ